MYNKSIKDYAWILTVISFVAGITDFRFAFIGLILMSLQIYHSYKIRRKIFCVRASSKKSPIKDFLRDIDLKYVIPDAICSKAISITIILFCFYTLGITVFYTGIENISSILIKFLFIMCMIFSIIGVNKKQTNPKYFK